MAGLGLQQKGKDKAIFPLDKADSSYFFPISMNPVLNAVLHFLSLFPTEEVLTFSL